LIPCFRTLMTVSYVRCRGMRLEFNPNNHHYSLLPCGNKSTLCNFFPQFAFNTTITTTLGKIDEAVDVTTEASIHEPPEEEEILHSVKAKA
jgi:hypothetical protein